MLADTRQYGQRRKSLWQTTESRRQTKYGRTIASHVNAKSFLSSGNLSPNVKLLQHGWVKDGLRRNLVPGGGGGKRQMLIIWWWISTLVNACDEDYKNWCLDWRLRNCHPFLVGIHGLLIPIMMKLLNTSRHATQILVLQSHECGPLFTYIVSMYMILICWFMVCQSRPWWSYPTPACVNNSLMLRLRTVTRV